MNWQQQIEAQIAELKASHCRCTRRKSTCRRSDERDAAETIRRLLDVAVAAEKVHDSPFQGGAFWLEMKNALDKLRGVSDD